MVFVSIGILDLGYFQLTLGVCDYVTVSQETSVNISEWVGGEHMLICFSSHSIDTS